MGTPGDSMPEGWHNQPLLEGEIRIIVDGSQSPNAMAATSAETLTRIFQKEHDRFASAFDKKDLMASTEKVHEHVHTVLSVTPEKDAFKARITEHWSMDIIDRIPMFGTKDAPHKLSGKETYDETWVKVGDAWKVKDTQEISEDILVDGKPAK